jgi:hypothetical protein
MIFSETTAAERFYCLKMRLRRSILRFFGIGP